MSLTNKLSIHDLDLNSKRVLIRVDYNVPLDSDRKVTDARRIQSTMATIKMVRDKGAKSIVLISHLGRPNGKPNKDLSLKHIIPTLNECLSKINAPPATFIPTLNSSEEYKTAISSPSPGSIFLLENLRFHLEEEGKGLDADGKKVTASTDDVEKFRDGLSKLGDVFIFDAFAAAHRAHSSVVGIHLEKRAAGLLMQKELEYFAKALETPKKPFLSILGGAKVSDKILLIENLLDKVDEMIIGGGMAYTFLKVMNGMSIGDSLYDEKGAKIVPRILKLAKEKNVRIHLPIDFVLADKFSPDAAISFCDSSDGIPSDKMGLDCGDKTRDLFSKAVHRANTIVWNGPLGVFEFDAFAQGTKKVLQALSQHCKDNSSVVSIIGGGDTASAAEKFGVAHDMSHVSTGGGASLELLEGKVLPGVSHLSDQ